MLKILPLAFHPARTVAVATAALLAGVAVRAGVPAHTIGWTAPWHRPPAAKRWRPAPWPWGRACGGPDPSPAAPPWSEAEPTDVDCLPDARSARVTLEVSSFGCFHGDEAEVTVEWSPAGATVRTLSTSGWAFRSALGVSPQPLDGAEARTFAREVVEMTHLVPEPMTYVSTERVWATLEWTCDGAPLRRHIDEADGAANFVWFARSRWFR